MDGLRLHAGLLGHALGGAARRRRKQDLRALGREDPQDGVEQRGLADARAAGHDHDLRLQRHGDRLALRSRQRLPRLLLDPRHGDRGIDFRPSVAPRPQGKQPVGDAPFRDMQAAQEMQSVPSMVSATTSPLSALRPARS